MKLSDENQCLVFTKLLLEAGCSPCELNGVDKPPIQIAVTRGFLSVVKIFLSQDVPLPPRVLFAALQVTVTKRVEMIRLLISKGAKVDVLNSNGDSLLHVTVRSPDRSPCLEIAKRLVDVGCDPCSRNIGGETPLCIAAKQRHYEVVKYLMLLSSPLDVQSLLESPVSTLRSLICNADGARFLPAEEDMVFQVIRRFINHEGQCLELAKTFIGDGSGPSAHISGSGRLLEIAVRQGFSEVVELLSVQAISFLPAILLIALRHQAPASTILLLIRTGAHVHVREDNGDTLLHVAMATSRFGQIELREMTQALIEAGCNPWTSNSASKRPIHIAVSRGFSSIAKDLLAHHLNTPSPLPVGISKDIFLLALQNFEDTKCRAMIQVLVEAGCNPLTLDSDSEQFIRIAVDKGFPSVVQYLLSHTETSVSLPTDVFHAVMQNLGAAKCRTMTKVLAEAGGNPFTLNSDDKQPIHIAVSKGFFSVVKYLLSHAKETSASLPTDIFHAAIENLEETKCRAMMKVLVEAGCDSFIPDSVDKQPIYIAMSRGFLSVVKYLLSQIQVPPTDIFHFAMQSLEETRCHEMTQVLVEAGCDPFTLNCDNEQPIHIAAFRGLPSVVIYLSSRYLNTSTSLPRNILHIAVTTPRREETACLAMTRALVEADCNPFLPDSGNKQPIHFAVSRGFLSVAAYLLEHYQNTSTPFPPDLLFSAVHGDKKYPMVSLLVSLGTNRFYCILDTRGDYLLHVLLRSIIYEEECLQITRILCETGYDYFAPGVDGRTPLHIAVIRKFTTIVDYLLSRNMPLPSDILFTVLGTFFEDGNPKWTSTISSLVRKGADIHARDSTRHTILHRAMCIRPESRCLEVTRTLIKAGCDIHARDCRGRTPLDIATASGCSAAAWHLRQISTIPQQ